MGAYTTAAVINNGMFRPEKPISALRFMPNHREYAADSNPLSRLSAKELQERDIYLGKVYELAAKLKARNNGNG